MDPPIVSGVSCKHRNRNNLGFKHWNAENENIPNFTRPNPNPNSVWAWLTYQRAPFPCQPWRCRRPSSPRRSSRKAPSTSTSSNSGGGGGGVVGTQESESAKRVRYESGQWESGSVKPIWPAPMGSGLDAPLTVVRCPPSWLSLAVTWLVGPTSHKRVYKRPNRAIVWYGSF